VKIRGFRIELGEIEAILGQHPAVRETAVIAREDRPGDKRLVAYVVMHQTSNVTANELRIFLRRKLPDYMLPSAFVILDSLPFTPNGKVDRQALPAPVSERPDLEDSYVAPRTPIEKILLGIWCETLGVERLGVQDNFFALGGHSLLATRVILRLRRVFDVDLALRCLFESPTVEELAVALLHSSAEREKVQKRAALLVKVAELSEDDVNAMLQERFPARGSEKKYNG
jgi:hypothetical protein